MLFLCRQRGRGAQRVVQHPVVVSGAFDVGAAFDRSASTQRRLGKGQTTLRKVPRRGVFLFFVQGQHNLLRRQIRPIPFQNRQILRKGGWRRVGGKSWLDCVLGT